jgi:2-oxoisovalerate dehydrogenase E1 component alpha subunit
MDFLKPAEVTPIATYHVMDTHSSVADPSRAPPDVTDEQVLEWYKNMVTGGWKKRFHCDTSF